MYGESKNSNVTIEQYHVNFIDPDFGGPSTFNLRMFGYTDFNEWFACNPINQPDNAFI